MPAFTGESLSGFVLNTARDQTQSRVQGSSLSFKQKTEIRVPEWQARDFHSSPCVQDTHGHLKHTASSLWGSLQETELRKGLCFLFLVCSAPWERQPNTLPFLPTTAEGAPAGRRLENVPGTPKRLSGVCVIIVHILQINGAGGSGI